MNVESLEFWQQVKAEYIKSEYVYLCAISNIFEYAWHWYNKDIKQLCSEFLKDKNNTHYLKLFFVGRGVLFETRSKSAEKVTNSIRRQVRLDFFDWCIEKFKNPNP